MRKLNLFLLTTFSLFDFPLFAQEEVNVETGQDDHELRNRLSIQNFIVEQQKYILSWQKVAKLLS